MGLFVAIALAAWFAQSRGWFAVAWKWGRGEATQKAATSVGMKGTAGMEGMELGETSAESESHVPGYAPLVIEPGIQQQLGVTVGSVRREPLRMSVQTVGIVQPNETKTARIYLRTQGWVEELYVNFIGQTVEKGDRLLGIYSPEFLAAQQEYLIARKNDSTPRMADQSITEATLQKLKLWNVPAEELRELEQTGRPQVMLTMRSPVSGTVLEKDVLEGEHITPERQLYVVSDLSTVWVQAKIYQYELPHVELGKPATVTVPGLPRHSFDGKVVFSSLP